MSINEGVVFANNLSLENTRKFFESYLASYLELEKSERIKSIYKNIRRWRGGQLAINAAAGGNQFYSTLIKLLLMVAGLLIFLAVSTTYHR